MIIGEKIKQLRSLHGLTQEELADRCDLTKGYISQIENDLTSPAISTLTDILNALGTNLKEFFGSLDTEEKIVFTKGDYFTKDNGDHQITWLVPNSQKNEMEPIILELNPESETVVDMPHEGQEFGYVLQGEVEIIHGNQKVVCKEGESFYYTTDKKHYLRNPLSAPAKIIWVSSPPNF